jgi:hypothetical protein
MITSRPWRLPLCGNGYGRELSNLGIQESVNKKLVCVVPIKALA